MSQRLIVAIDGPAGAGKSTVTRRLATELGYTHIDTGAMYRGVALASREAGIDWEDAGALTALAQRLHFEFDASVEPARLLVDGRDVSGLIRTPEMSRGASTVSQCPGVRSALVAHQQLLGREGGVVMEGRDIGTVVFPEAEVKVFLTATSQERARRRASELRNSGEDVDEAQVLQDVEERDRRDSEREHSPLRQAEDAVEVLTDGLTLDQVVERLVRLVRERGGA